MSLETLDSFVTCPACKERMTDQAHAPVAINCGHTICRACAENPANPNCPVCRTPIMNRVPNLHLQALIAACCEPAKPKEEPAEKFCTYEAHGKKYIRQKWYHCRTCGLVGAEGCCEVCAEKCHAGHDVVYEGVNRQAFCDCGPSGKCLSLRRLDDSDSTLCTFATHGMSYIVQPWYHCATCNLVGSLGCCEACARVCHAGHVVTKAGHLSAYCDCGNGSGKVDCKCLKPQGGERVTYCTYFARSGESFEQIMYQCLDCGIVDSTYMCEACMKVCHVGHQIRRVNGLVNAICGCGAGICPNPCAFGSSVGTEELMLSPCTVAITGKDPIRQMWFECRTCGLTGDKGMCEVCARVCHMGHDVICSGICDMCDCDCGGGRGRIPCKCMKWASPTKCSRDMGPGARRQMLFSCDSCGTKNLCCVYCVLHCHRDHKIRCAGYDVGVCGCSRCRR